MPSPPPAAGQEAVTREVRRLEEDCIYSGKGHFNAADRWAHVHLWLGIPAALLAALAGASAWKNQPDLVSALAIAASGLTAVLTFLNPQQRHTAHVQAGAKFFAIRDEARVLREVELANGLAADEAVARIKDLSKRRSDLNLASPQIPGHAYRKGKKGIAAGEATYSVDIANGNGKPDTNT